MEAPITVDFVRYLLERLQNHQSVKEYIALEKFNLIKKHDNIKTQYCKDNNIKLIRIPYWDYKNIEKILVEELNLK